MSANAGNPIKLGKFLLSGLSLGIIGFWLQIAARTIPSPFNLAFLKIFGEYWAPFTILGVYAIIATIFGVWFIISPLFEATRKSQPNSFTYLIRLYSSKCLSVMGAGFGLQIGALLSTVGSGNVILRFTSAASALLIFALSLLVFNFSHQQEIPIKDRIDTVSRILFGAALLLQPIYIFCMLTIQLMGNPH